MRILIWHWGRYGAGPRYAAALSRHLGDLPGIEALLSLPENAEILRGDAAPRVHLLVKTYASRPGFILRALTAPFRVHALTRKLAALRPDVALCAMPAMLDLLMVAALRRLRVPIAVIVHDAEPHPGEVVPLQHRLQRLLLRRTDRIATLSTHVAERLRLRGETRPILVTRLPPLTYGPVAPPLPHGGPLRLLSFGRLLPYKGLDLLADALAQLGPDTGLTVRIVGQGPESEALTKLRSMPGVHVENRWAPETEVPGLLAWADAVVLSHREASQSGVAAAALAAGRRVVATRVGGLIEQLQHEKRATLCLPNPDALAAALRDLPRDTAPDCAGRQEIEQAWQQTAEEIAEMLRGSRL